MKKIMMMLAALAVSVPFISASALDILNCSVSEPCYTYTAGEEVNFYKTKEEAELGSTSSGVTTIVLEDNGSDSQYVRALSAFIFGTSTPYFDSNEEKEPMTLVKKENLSEIESTQGALDSVKTDSDGNYVIDYITLDELISVFGATKNADGTYSIDVDTWGSTFETFAIGSFASEGFYTSTYDTETNKVWVVDYTWSSNDISAITVKEVDMENNTYGYLPVMYFDKTYDCKERTVTPPTTEDEYACYSCDDDYTWTKVGSQASTCTLVESVTSKSSCVVSAKTGVEDYIIEFVGVAFVCGIAFYLAKRKDLFRNI